jgi:prepilin-type N-terminal cleavage/methylation domain-containing protein
MDRGIVVRAFTLIELLIVVAIIAVLALIAVPNFLEAQTRAKVSRVQADQRSIVTALEVYFVDNNDYPCRNVRLGAGGFWQRQLTTPIAYMTGCCCDPFCGDGTIDNMYYQFAHCERMKSHMLCGVGPDGIDDFDEAMFMCGMAMTYPPIYDPTNGTVSRGDVWRISKQGGPVPR